MAFVTKDSGERIEFGTGAVRDVEDDKPAYDLVGIHGLTRLAWLMRRGAAKYGKRNWEKGQNVSRSYASAFRHLIQYFLGDRSEDHLAAVAFNVFSIMHVEEEAKAGRDGFKELLDIEFYEDAEEFYDIFKRGNPEYAPVNVSVTGVAEQVNLTKLLRIGVIIGLLMQTDIYAYKSQQERLEIFKNLVHRIYNADKITFKYLYYENDVIPADVGNFIKFCKFMANNGYAVYLHTFNPAIYGSMLDNHNGFRPKY